VTRIWDDVIGAEEQAAYVRGGWGGRIGFGERPALVVVDMYRAFVDPDYPFSSPEAPATADAIAELLGDFRAAGLPVFHTRGRPEPTPAARGRWKVTATTSDPRMRDPEAYAFWPAVAPVDGEHVFEKTYPSGFFGTTLASQLVYHRVDTLVVTGTVTQICVEETARESFKRGYWTTVVSDAVSTYAPDQQAAVLKNFAHKFGWVSTASEIIAELESRRGR